MKVSCELVGRNTAKRRKTTENESVNCDYIFFANIGKIYIIAVNRLIRCCFSSFCGVSTYKFNRYPSSQASADPTSDVHIVAFPFSIYHVNAGSDFATVTFFIVFKMCWHFLNAVLMEVLFTRTFQFQFQFIF